ncbi:hypothetical protein HK096_008596, partial [Nowakowskiella sp. JEL0078]
MVRPSNSGDILIASIDVTGIQPQFSVDGISISDIQPNINVTFRDLTSCQHITAEFVESHEGKILQGFFTFCGDIFATLTLNTASLFSVPNSVKTTPSLNTFSSPISTPLLTPSLNGIDFDFSDMNRLDSLPMWIDFQNSGNFEKNWFEKDKISSPDYKDILSQYLQDGCIDSSESVYIEENVTTFEQTSLPVNKSRDSDTTSVFSLESGCDAMYIPEGDCEDPYLLLVNQNWYMESLQQHRLPLESLLACLLAAKSATTQELNNNVATITDSLLTVLQKEAISASFLQSDYENLFVNKSRVGLGLAKPHGLHFPKAANCLKTRNHSLSSRAERRLGWTGNSITIPSNLSKPYQHPLRMSTSFEISKVKQQNTLSQLLPQHTDQQKHQQRFLQIKQASAFVEMVQETQRVRQQLPPTSKNLASSFADKFQH